MDQPIVERGPRDQGEDSFATDVPARLDRLPWARFHWLVVVALGVTWILDGLEVTLVGSLAGALGQKDTLALTGGQVGAAASFYLAGAILGALFFGYLTDRIGRRKLFMVTVGIYAVATVATGFSWNFWSFVLFRFVTGCGIGGEYVAINSAIQELIPARYRGWTDLAINGSYWIGAALGAGGSLIVLDPALVPPTLGWRLAFGIGGVLAVIIVFLRRHIPESPRWLMIHGRDAEARETVAGIEARVAADHGPLPPIPADGQVRLMRREVPALTELIHSLLVYYPRRTIVCIVLMASQAFFYNAIFFTYAMMLGKFYNVPANAVGNYILAFAAGNFFGPLLLGRLFDVIGRRALISGTYLISGVLMAITAWLFVRGDLTAVGQTVAWTVIFFFASAAASSAYLTIGESFPLEVRALVIALFYAGGTALGGIAGPPLFGALIESGSRVNIMWGYLFAAGLMIVAAIVEAWLGTNAERKSLEEVALPLSSYRHQHGLSGGSPYPAE